MIETLTAGIILGLSAGFAPGPLLALVVSETLQHGIRSGIRVALAPVITDLPIIVFTFLLSTLLYQANILLGLISMAGGGFVIWLGIEGLRIKKIKTGHQSESLGSLPRGIIANALSPHPYLFWLTVGTPILSRTMNTGMAIPLAFIISFYACLLGSKIFLAMMVGHARGFLQGKAYQNTMRLLGLMMCAFALMLFHDGLILTGAL